MQGFWIPSRQKEAMKVMSEIGTGVQCCITTTSTTSMNIVKSLHEMQRKTLSGMLLYINPLNEDASQCCVV